MKHKPHKNDASFGSSNVSVWRWNQQMSEFCSPCNWYSTAIGSSAFEGRGLPISQFNLSLIIFYAFVKGQPKEKKKEQKQCRSSFKKSRPLFVLILVNGLLQDSTVKHFIRICEWMWKIILLHFCKRDVSLQQISKASLKIYHKTTSSTLWMAYCLKAVFLYFACASSVVGQCKHAQMFLAVLFF